ncbi:MAG: glycerophosphodiester phosphodiesterase family protein [Bacteroidota bacterium]
MTPRQSDAASGADPKRRRFSRRRVALAVLAVGIATVYIGNASWIVGPGGDEPPAVLAHRGLAQIYDRTNLTNETCTAERLLPTGHEYLENTIPSMQAAFDLGADVVEFDIHPTKDGRFAVFHDWTLDCRTEGNGRTRDHTLAELQALDIGYGYTADEGETYPFRGRGAGGMPSLTDVLEAFPDRDLLIDVKGGTPDEGAMLMERLRAMPFARRQRLMVYGGPAAVSMVRDSFPEIQTIWAGRLKTCLTRYAALGWSGHVPAACERSLVTVPANVGPWLWGWPHRFVQRMEAAGSRVFILGDWNGEPYSTAFDDPARLGEIPEGFGGGVWTDRADRIAPALRSHSGETES